MSYTMRRRWPLALGIATAMLLAVLGWVAGGEDASEAGSGLDAIFLGMAKGFWALAAIAVIAGLAGQMMLNNRMALERERRLVRTAAQLRETSAELDRLSKTDPLTGIPNRRAFFEIFGIEFRRSRRYRRQLSVLMIDLDHFKQINDRWGHPFGDHVLREVARIISENIRESDILGRYGGEEFVLALPEASIEHAVQAAEKLWRAVEAAEFRTEDLPPPGEPAVKMTVSIGISALPVEEHQDGFELIQRADQALYEAKRTGRNRASVFAKAEALAPVDAPTSSVIDV